MNAATPRLTALRLPVRALIVGSALMPLNAFWLVRMEMVAGGALRDTSLNGPYPTNISLFANVIFIVVGLSVINIGLRRYFPRLALTQTELLLIYVMLSIGTCLTSIDFLDVLFPMLGHAVYYANPVNGWDALFVRFLPSWWIVTDKAALTGWYHGASPAYTMANLSAWATPLLTWGAFILILLGTMFCINVLLRVAWTRTEKLSYPILHLPLEVTNTEYEIYRRPLFWIGFGVSGGICLWNGLSVLFPSLPLIPIKGLDLAQFVTEKPWNAMGWTPIAFYPFAIGMGFLLPTDLLFSAWAFCLMWRGERIASAALGLAESGGRFPYVNEQSFGAYMGVACIAFWGLRPHLAAVWRSAQQGENIPDAPLSYRAAFFVVVTGFVCLILFFMAAGLPVWAAVAGFVIYFAIALACTRMRAELGPPAHDLHNGGPDYILTAIFGSRAFSPPELTALTFFYWFNRAYRTIAMPYQLEAFKIAEQRQISPKSVTVTLAIATVMGLLSGFWALYATGYQRGAEAQMASHFTGFGWEAFGRLASWIQTPRGTDIPAAIAIAVGLTAALILHLLRIKFLWWPLHPMGLAISGSFSLTTLWLPLFIAWVCKSLILRYFGLPGYRIALPFFLGLTMGDFIVGCLWPLIGNALGVNTYSFYF